ncbi:hypothetical protein [Nocardioides sp.]|uniref:hypothetical protein n=1 Tax=Nocardioides sp. TaxID=35761 RepID=UPI003561DDD9
MSDHITATFSGEDVFIVADVAMANAIADALEFTFASGGLDDLDRPDYLLDVVQIRSAVAAAQQDSAPVPDLVWAPLRVVGGDE